MKANENYNETAKKETREFPLNGIEMFLIIVSFIVTFSLLVLVVCSCIAQAVNKIALSMNISEIWADRLAYGLAIANALNSVRMLKKLFKISIQEEEVRRKAVRREKFFREAHRLYGDKAEEMFKDVRF